VRKRTLKAEKETILTMPAHVVFQKWGLQKDGYDGQIALYWLQVTWSACSRSAMANGRVSSSMLQ
jgi:hypothetical protein